MRDSEFLVEVPDMKKINEEAEKVRDAYCKMSKTCQASIFPLIRKHMTFSDFSKKPKAKSRPKDAKANILKNFITKREALVDKLSQSEKYVSFLVKFEDDTNGCANKAKMIEFFESKIIKTRLALRDLTVKIEAIK